MDFIDYNYKPTPALPKYPPVRIVLPEPSHWLDREIVHFLRDQPEAVPTWSMANAVAAALNPPNRSKLRELKLQVLCRITPLVRTRYLRRVGRKYIALR